jgi:hypothetical protein
MGPWTTVTSRRPAPAPRATRGGGGCVRAGAYLVMGALFLVGLVDLARDTAALP